MSNQNAFSECSHILRESEYGDFQICFILSKQKNNDVHYLAYAYNDDLNEIISIRFTDENSFDIHHEAEWDFNIDEYFLYELESGYEVNHIPLEEHYNIWCAIDEQCDDIEHQDGLQKYLSYCHVNGISSHEIGLLQLTEVNIMDMYREENAGYTIIAETNCGDKAIVLAERKTDIARYVTWSTTKDRKRGFDIGHYFSDFKSAYRDFESRSHDMMDHQLSILKNKCRPKKKEHER